MGKKNKYKAQGSEGDKEKPSGSRPPNSQQTSQGSQQDQQSQQNPQQKPEQKQQQSQRKTQQQGGQQSQQKPQQQGGQQSQQKPQQHGGQQSQQKPQQQGGQQSQQKPQQQGGQQSQQKPQQFQQGKQSQQGSRQQQGQKPHHQGQQPGGQQRPQQGWPPQSREPQLRQQPGGQQRSQQGWQQQSREPQQGQQPSEQQRSQQGWQQQSRGPLQQHQGQQQQQQSPRSQQHHEGPQLRIGQQKPRFQQVQQPIKTEISRASSVCSDSSFASSKTRIKRGTIGKSGKVETNYLQMNMEKMPEVAYHYDVTIDPDRPKKHMRVAFTAFNRKYLPDTLMAYDGKKSCYTMTKLPQKSYQHEVEVDDAGSRKKTYKITLKETDSLEIEMKSLRSYYNDRVFDKPMRAMQALEVVLSNPCHDRGVRVGRSFFTKPERNYDLNEGYEMWTGLYQAVILGDQPFLNVDIAHKSFPKENRVIDYITQNNMNLDLTRPLNDNTIKSLESFLKGINIVYEPPQCFGSFDRTYKVSKVTQQPADVLSFTLETGERLTVAQYFESRNYRLRYPKLPCIDVGSIRATFFPLELCKIPAGQTINKKDGPRQVQAMIKYAATSTDERKAKIMSLLSYFAHNNDWMINKFGIRIGSSFIEVPMRQLNSPKIEYFGQQSVNVMNGSWRRGDNFLITQPTPPSGYKWAIIYSQRGRLSSNDCYMMAQTLSKTARDLNMGLVERPLVKDYRNVDLTLQELKANKFDIVFVILSSYNSAYSDTKQAAELKHGILTQCIKEATVQRRFDIQTVNNILLKVNAKLNGTNHKILAQTHITLNKVMFMGADVTHPSPDQKHIPSVVGVTASSDTNGACYNMQYRLQRSTLETIEDMASIFEHHMKVYHAKQNYYPEHVIYYRDGVSDGQFPFIRDQELRAMRMVCSRLQVKIKITCIIVVKRHHTRFFPPPSKAFDKNNKFNNVPPGTVVDQVIVHPNEVQFFMVSHQSIQGTAKPTRYNVIVDDANMDINDLQVLTNNMCHMFPRCNRVVSYPAPAYLAHLAAYRGRVYIEGLDGGGRALADEYRRRLINEDLMNRNPSFFV